MAAAQMGFAYEEEAFKALQKYKISTGTTAGGSATLPDLTIKMGSNKSGVELKNGMTAAGSLVMQYYNGAWHFGPTEGHPEKELMKKIGMSVKILDLMNKEWKKPVLQYQGSSKIYVGAKNAREAYNIDLAKFGGKGGDLYVDVANKKISDYYNKKDTWYLNIGTHGFFLLNTNDPLNLNKKLNKAGITPIPNFSTPSMATTKIRVRVHNKGSSSGYQFSFTLQFSGVKKSPHNLAPLMVGSKYKIDTIKLKKEALIGIF